MQIYNCLNLIFRTNVLCLKFLFEYIQKSKYINMTFNSRASFLFRKIKQKNLPLTQPSAMLSYLF